MREKYDLPKNISWHKRFKKYEITIRRNREVVFYRSTKTLDEAILIRDEAIKSHGKGWGQFRRACTACGKLKAKSYYKTSETICEFCCAARRKEQRKAKQDARNSCPTCGKVLAKRKPETVGKPCQKCAKKDPRRSCTRCGDEFLPKSRNEKRCDNCKPSKLASMRASMESKFRVLNRHLLCKCGNFFSTEENKKRCPDCSSAQTKVYFRECPACSVQFFARLRHARYCVKHRRRNIKAFGQSGWSTVREQIIDRDGCTCQYCQTEITGRVTVDHMIALARDSNQSPIDPSNLVVACLQCNGAKQDKTPLEFFEYKHSTIGGLDGNV